MRWRSRREGSRCQMCLAALFHVKTAVSVAPLTLLYPHLIAVASLIFLISSFSLFPCSVTLNKPQQKALLSCQVSPTHAKKKYMKNTLFTWEDVHRHTFLCTPIETCTHTNKCWYSTHSFAHTHKPKRGVREACRGWKLKTNMEKLKAKEKAPFFFYPCSSVSWGLIHWIRYLVLVIISVCVYIFIFSLAETKACSPYNLNLPLENLTSFCFHSVWKLSYYDNEYVCLCVRKNTGTDTNCDLDSRLWQHCAKYHTNKACWS